MGAMGNDPGAEVQMTSKSKTLKTPADNASIMMPWRVVIVLGAALTSINVFQPIEQKLMAHVVSG